MDTILFLAHTDADAWLGKPALETLTTARDLHAAMPGSTLTVGIVGDNVQPAANALAGCGAARFLGVAGPEFAQPRYATDAAAAEALCRASEATLIVAPATSRWNRVLPGVAHRLGGRVDTHASAVQGGATGTPQVTRWYYRQRIEATLCRTQRPWMILVDPGTQPAWQGTPGNATVQLVPVALTDAARRTTVVGKRELPADAQTIRPDAALLFVAGAGWTKKQADGQTHGPEAEKLISDFLRLTRASLGSSKSLVDLGGEGQPVLSFLSHLNQVGQTGSTPRHPKGLSTCCHGEEPHTVGWRFIGERRAISLDPNCGWARGKADVLYVADAFAVMKKVNDLLAASKPATLPETG
jgi:electron transfer flavoprotein alpha subunit